MDSLRSGVARPVFILALVLAVAACGSSAGSVPPVAVSAAPSTAASAAAVGSVVAASQAPSIAAGGGASDCAGLTGGHVKYTLSGLEAWHFCGPATASVTLAAATVTVTSGWCETNAAGYSVAIGTQLFGNPDPAQEPDMFLVLASPSTGVGTISGVVGHKHWAILGGTVAFTSGQHGGTFSGSDVSGAAVHGSFTC